MRISAVIVDDEPLARRRIRSLLAREPDVDVVQECGNGTDAVDAIRRRQPDLVFLDVQMPEMNGFEVVRALGAELSGAVVFVTAFEQFSLQAFEVHALDYLLKPFSEERFKTVMQRVREQLGHPRTPAGTMASALRKKPLQRVVVRSDDGSIQVVPVSRIDYVEAADDAIVIVTGGVKLKKQQTIGDLANELDPDRFVRVHRSYLLNIERIEKIELYAKDSRVAILRDGSKLPISRSGYARLKELL